MNEQMRYKGHIRLLRADTRELLAEADNLVVDTGLSLALQCLTPGGDGNPLSLPLTYCAIGTGTTTPAHTDTTLTTESARAQITLGAVVAADSTIQTFMPSAIAGIHIKEVGLFGGATASETADSGTLFSHALLDYDNSVNLFDLVVTWVISASA